MVNRYDIKMQAKAQIKDNLGILILSEIIIMVIAATMIGSILTPVLSVGLITIYLGLTKEKPAEVGDLFSMMDLFGKSLLLYILIGIFTFLWSLLLVVPGIIKGLSYSMAPYILAEQPQLTALEALNESKRIMKGHIGDYFVLQLSFIPWILLGAVTCGLAYLYVGPYIASADANFYNAIKN